MADSINSSHHPFSADPIDASASSASVLIPELALAPASDPVSPESSTSTASSIQPSPSPSAIGCSLRSSTLISELPSSQSSSPPSSAPPSMVHGTGLDDDEDSEAITALSSAPSTGGSPHGKLSEKLTDLIIARFEQRQGVGSDTTATATEAASGSGLLSPSRSSKTSTTNSIGIGAVGRVVASSSSEERLPGSPGTPFPRIPRATGPPSIASPGTHTPHSPAGGYSHSALPHTPTSPNVPSLFSHLETDKEPAAPWDLSSAYTVPTDRPFQTRFLFCLFIYPIPGNNLWKPLMDCIRNNPEMAFLIIVNPNSGPHSANVPPGSSLPHSDYTNAIPELRRCAHPGQIVELLGYVSTRWASKPLAEIQHDIETYARWPEKSNDPDMALDGIYLDETPWSAEGVSITRKMAEFARRCTWSQWLRPKIQEEAEGSEGRRVAYAGPGVSEEAKEDGLVPGLHREAILRELKTRYPGGRTGLVAENPGCWVHQKYYDHADHVVVFEHPVADFDPVRMIRVPPEHAHIPPQKRALLMYTGPAPGKSAPPLRSLIDVVSGRYAAPPPGSVASDLRRNSFNPSARPTLLRVAASPLAAAATVSLPTTPISSTPDVGASSSRSSISGRVRERPDPLNILSAQRYSYETLRNSMDTVSAASAARGGGAELSAAAASPTWRPSLLSPTTTHAAVQSTASLPLPSPTFLSTRSLMKLSVRRCRVGAVFLTSLDLEGKDEDIYASFGENFDEFVEHFKDVTQEAELEAGFY